MRAGVAVVVVLAWAAGCGRAAAQEDAGSIDRAFTAQTVEALAGVVEREYFAPEPAARMAAGLRNGLAGGRYDQLRTIEALAEALTRELRADTADKHLSVSLVRHPDAGPKRADTDRAARGRRDNFGVKQVEVLPGNVGYLDITAFYRPEEARETISAAMRVLRHADALILDLRENGGGSTGTVALLASYLFEAPGLPLFDVVPRNGDSHDYATEDPGPVERDGARPVYALTAARTFSGGEGLAFLLQERGRAEIVGERTAGAANPGRPYPLNQRLEVTVPNGRVRSAVKGGNWEGSGVAPDVPVPAADALRVAQARALRNLIGRESDSEWRDALQRALAALEEAGHATLTGGERSR